MCVYIYIYIHVCVCIYIYIYIYMHIHAPRRADQSFSKVTPWLKVPKDTALGYRCAV